MEADGEDGESRGQRLEDQDDDEAEYDEDVNTPLFISNSIHHFVIVFTIQQQTKQQDLSDSSMFDMPLPPPPLDLQDSGHSNPHLHTNGKNYFYDKP